MEIKASTKGIGKDLLGGYIDGKLFCTLRIIRDAGHFVYRRKNRS
jgi:hypothetical protein